MVFFDEVKPARWNFAASTLFPSHLASAMILPCCYPLPPTAVSAKDTPAPGVQLYGADVLQACHEPGPPAPECIHSPPPCLPLTVLWTDMSRFYRLSPNAIKIFSNEHRMDHCSSFERFLSGLGQPATCCCGWPRPATTASSIVACPVSAKSA